MLVHILLSSIGEENSQQVLIYGVLGGQVWHPPELFKPCQVFKLGLDEIRHLNGADISNLALSISTLKLCPLFITAKIGLKSGRC